MNQNVLSLNTNTENEQKNYTREEQLNLFGYVTARDLTSSEISELSKYTSVLSKRTVAYNKVKTTIYELNVYITPRLIVKLTLKPEQYEMLGGILKLDLENYNEFEFKLPVRLLSGKTRKNSKPYYQYEVFLAHNENHSWFVRKYFKPEQSIMIEFNNDLMKEFVIKNGNLDEDSVNGD